MQTAPSPDPRPKLAQYLFDRGMTYREASVPLETTHETVRRMCLPFSDPQRRVPRPPLMTRIQAWTQGEISPADFYQPMSLAS